MVIFLITFAAGLLCSALSIKASRDAILSNYVDMALNEQFRVGYAIKKMGEYRAFTEEEANIYLLGAIQSAALSYAEYTDSVYFGVSDDDAGTIFSNIPEASAAMFVTPPKQDGSVLYFVDRSDDKIMVFVSSYVKIYQKMFRVDYAADITDISVMLGYISKNVAIQLFIVESMLFILISLAVKKALKPLDSLREHTQKIAGGFYDERVKIFREDEVGQLAASVNQMSQAIAESVVSLKEAAYTKELLASNLAHELKTPLTSVVAYADYAIQKDLEKEEMNGILEHIRKEGKRLSELSDKILKWNSINRPDSVDIRPCRPERIIEQSLYTLSKAAETKKQHIAVNLSAEIIYADEALIVSLIVNLTKNALNASADSAVVKLSITNSENGDLIICLEDNGIGIKEDELLRIAEPFYMVDKARDRSKGGSGLGLSLCKSIVAAHNGKMNIESRYGEGTLVTVTLPQG